CVRCSRRDARARRSSRSHQARPAGQADHRQRRRAGDRRMSGLRIDVLTIFPELFPGPLGASIPGRALERGLASLAAHDLREWGLGRHRSVDDYPYGGGVGMIMRPEPIHAALTALADAATTKILLDPGGVPFNQN